ncbi:16S rRNA (uracil(1498)-N(3))-methyltransferase [Nostocoides sp. F2B08]|uniref:16S rRNA (uracil(1498)-N(3))-methyltransferase n=1 Tax=Nostocoides sp. F2B08 TaxID=2653936 RepID=UPI001263459B|nr:16S rRNA (uracil(1498)-N(3))-methyltransferase [Tetrasphaera sp. F2B08]KAB7744752.1 16S rRNA (uracil(1498)-N(3))-methyltransferase [Tetrasphaera sp. F2B08]
MSRPVFVLEPDRFAAVGSSVVLAGPEGRHAAVVRRIGPGERVDLVDGRGRRAVGLVETVHGAELTVRVEHVEEEPLPSPRLVLVQALAKGDRDDQAVEAATELGVDAIVPWQAARSIVQWRGPRGEKARRKWVDQVYAAAKQSRRARFPDVETLVDTSALVRRTAVADATFVLHEEARTPLAGAPLPAAGEVLVVVGPEGGIAPEELAALEAAGAVPVRLGGTVLRSSSAGPAALAVISAAGRWRRSG